MLRENAVLDTETREALSIPETRYLAKPFLFEKPLLLLMAEKSAFLLE
jgi:hypothetical protein